LPDAPQPTSAQLTEAQRLAEEGKSVVLVAKGTQLLGCFAVADTLREDSAAAVKTLHGLGTEVVMLTGDNAAVAQKIAAMAGVQQYRAELLPAGKERIVREHTEKGITAMVGDGINDAPALAGADIGIAIGAGTGVAMESAGGVLAGNSLMDAAAAIELGRATRRNIRQNLFWALCYNTVCIPLAAGVLYPALGILLTPMLASAAMSLSSVFVVCNALRLARFVPPAIADRVKLQKEDQKLKDKKEDEEMFGFQKKEQTTVVLTVEGMACGHCAARVEGALAAVKGVKSAKVNLEQKTVTVVCAGVEEKTLRDTVTAAGYTVV
jgi:cation transport ATPase